MLWTWVTTEICRSRRDTVKVVLTWSWVKNKLMILVYNIDGNGPKVVEHNILQIAFTTEPHHYSTLSQTPFFCQISDLHYKQSSTMKSSLV